jgi:hypothetical protein
VEDSFGHTWGHVWNTREAAERFAARLRKETRNPDWEVYELSPLGPTAGEQPDHPGPIDILVGRQSHGNTYNLDPRSYRLLRQRFPRGHGRPTVFIGRDTNDGYEAPRGPIYDRVVTLLTGLSLEQLLDAFGGYRVVDPLSNLTLWEAKRAAG